MQQQLNFPKTSRPAVGPTLHPFSIIHRCYFPGYKMAWCLKMTTNLSIMPGLGFDSFYFSPSKPVKKQSPSPFTALCQCLLCVLRQSALHFVRIGRKWRWGLYESLVSIFGGVGVIFGEIMRSWQHYSPLNQIPVVMAYAGWRMRRTAEWWMVLFNVDSSVG